MSEEMLQDALDNEKRKVKVLSIILTIALCALVGMTIFAVCSFDVTTEETSEIIYTADTGSGNGNIMQANTEQAQDYSVYMICATVMVSIGLIVLGVYLHGKSKNDYSQNKKDNDKET